MTCNNLPRGMFFLRGHLNSLRKSTAFSISLSYKPVEGVQGFNPVSVLWWVRSLFEGSSLRLRFVKTYMLNSALKYQFYAVLVSQTVFVYSKCMNDCKRDDFFPLLETSQGGLCKHGEKYGTCLAWTQCPLFPVVHWSHSVACKLTNATQIKLFLITASHLKFRE